MKNPTLKWSIRLTMLFIFFSYNLEGFSQCEPWCEGQGGYYITYNAEPHSLKWHRNQYQTIYRKTTPGTYLGPGPINDIIPLKPPTDSSYNIQYYYNFGLFYVAFEGGYIVVPAPLGYTIPNIPYDAETIQYRGKKYNYYAGTFFIENPNNTYTTIKPPLGISVMELPPNCIMMNDANGMVLYRFGKTYYRPANWHGTLWYQVVHN